MLTSAPETASTLTPGLRALLTSAAFAPLPNVGWLRVTGSDRVRWLNGMVTNNIATLKPGEGNYNFFLNAQGRIQADCTAWMLEDSILLQTAADRVPALMAMLDHFIIMDDVELASHADRTGLLIAGPRALSIVQALGTRNHSAAPCAVPPAPLTYSSLNLKQTLYAGAPVDLVRADSPLVPRFELWSDPSTIAAIVDELAIAKATPEDLESLRILSGTPQYGTDIRNSETARDLPQETNQTRALHFAKGCYLGQEIVERIRSRGAVHRTFTGFLLTGDVPPANAQLLDDQSRPIGELTSVTVVSSQLIAQSSQLSETSLSPDQPTTIALGYIRREALDKKTPITYPGGTATPVTLPFQLPEMSA